MSHRHPAILMLGLPGTGKGTHGRILGAVPGFYHSASGDVFRSLDPATDLGRRVHERMSRGEMLSDDLAVSLWREHLRRAIQAGDYDPADAYLVLDGIPRTAGQARMLDEDLDVLRVVHLVCDEEELVKRLLRRAQEQNRADDADEAVIRHRIQTHRSQIDAVRSHYPASVVVEINSRGPILSVFVEVAKAALPLGSRR